MPESIIIKELTNSVIDLQERVKDLEQESVKDYRKATLAVISDTLVQIMNDLAAKANAGYIANSPSYIKYLTPYYKEYHIDTCDQGYSPDEEIQQFRIYSVCDIEGQTRDKHIENQLIKVLKKEGYTYYYTE